MMSWAKVSMVGPILIRVFIMTLNLGRNTCWYQRYVYNVYLMMSLNQRYAYNMYLNQRYVYNMYLNQRYVYNMYLMISLNLRYVYNMYLNQRYL